MRALTPTLLSAQKSGAHLPHVRVRVKDAVAGVPRLRWQRLYSGNEPDAPGACTMPGDGSLIRLRLDPTDNGRVLRQRVLDPGAQSDYSNWVNWGVRAHAIAIASSGANVFAFAVATNGALYRSESSDHGANWSAWLDMGQIHATEHFRVAACFKSTGDMVLLYGNGTAVLSRLLSGGTWQRSWVSPTSYNDPAGEWIQEENAYDGDTETDAYTWPILPDSWGNWLELAHNPLLCEKVRFFAEHEVSGISSIDLDVYDSDASSWIDVYQGDYEDKTWVEKSLDRERMITKARVRFYNGSSVAMAARLYELEFETPYVEWTNSMGSVTGISVAHSGDWNVMVTGTEASSLKPGVWTCVFGDGASAEPETWTELKALSTAASDSNMAFSYPILHSPDVYRAFFIEAFGGTEPYSRPYWTHSLTSAQFVENRWREPVPFDLSSEHGLSLCSRAEHAWLTRPDGVWRAPLTPSSVELTPDLIHLEARTTEGGGEINVALRNDEGRYSLVAVDEHSTIRMGSELAFSPGYRTVQGEEVSDGPTYWITGWDCVSYPGHATLALRAMDAWGLLERWKARHQFAWPAGEKNVLDLLGLVLARTGLGTTSSGGSDLLTSHRPAFTISPGETGGTAVKRLLSMVPDLLLFRGSVGCLMNPEASEEPDYAYGTDHSILYAKYKCSLSDANRVQVFGDGVFVELFDWEELDLVFDTLAQVHDLNLDTAEKAYARANATLRNADIHSHRGHILVPLNCGQELYDVIEITDPCASLYSAGKRVLGLTHVYDPANGRYDLRLELGAV
jgi:hypothetical protein